MEQLEKLVSLAKEREHNAFLTHLESILDNVESSVELHKGCYCTYISKKYKSKCVDGHTPDDEPPFVRVRRSQTLVNGSYFNFKEHCIFCNEKCIPLDPRHSDRWHRVRQCQTHDRPDIPTFRDRIVELARHRNVE